MTEEAMAPDRRAFLIDVEGDRFRVGEADRRWRLLESAWPIAKVAVRAAERLGAPEEFVLRFDLTGYPGDAPTAGLWDPSTDQLLSGDRRPKGDRVGRVFRTDWEGGRALYAPWDRVALAGHPDWARTMAMEAWTPRRDIAFYLERVWELLNADDYAGI